MLRIYVEISTAQLRSQNRGSSYLYYLQVKSYVKRNSGWFSLLDFMNATILSERTSLKHIKYLVKEGFIKQYGKKYRCINQKKIIGDTTASYVSIREDEIIQLTSYNLARFRAILTEIEIERYKRHQRAEIKGYTVTNQRDGSKERIHKPEKTAWVDVSSLEIASILSGMSVSTCSRYRRNQNFADYYWKKRVISLKDVCFDENWRAFLPDKGGKVLFTMGRDNKTCLYSPISKRTAADSFRMKRR